MNSKLLKTLLYETEQTKINHLPTKLVPNPVNCTEKQ